MRLRDPRILLAAASLGLVIWAFTLHLDRASPGPLSATHARVEALDAAEGCSRCHGMRRSSMRRGCAQCHQGVEDEIAEGVGFHGALAGIDPGACSSCHLEHAGRSMPLVSEGSFQLAGFAGRSAYDHRGLAFELHGRHLELACSKCHEGADADVLREGVQRFSSLDQSCESCHEDPHHGRMVLGCDACHGQERPFNEAAAFQHTDVFPLSGAHAGGACVDCHPRGGAHAVQAPTGERAVRARSCADCHDSPHSRGALRSWSAALGAPVAASCDACHPTARGGFTTRLSAMDPGLHAAAGFPLTPPHDEAACAACHEPSARDQAAFRPRGRVAGDCAACHADPHGGQFLGGPFAGAGCLACHDERRF